MTITFEILGVPIAKKRPRFARKGKYVTTYNDQESEEGRWIAQMMAVLTPQVKQHLPIPKGVPITLEAQYVFPPLKSWPKRMSRALMEGQSIPHTVKPDRDNLQKFMKDCMNKIIWADDSQVSEGHDRKYYGLTPKTIITVKW